MALRDKAEEVLSGARKVGRKALNVASNLSGVRETRKIRGYLRKATRR